MNPGAPENLIAEILRLSRRMRRESGRGPSAAELAGYLHLPLAEVRAALARAKDRAAKPGAAGGAAVPGGLSEALTAEEEAVLCRRFGIADQARTLRVPAHMVETINTLVRTSRRMEVEIGCEPTPEELAERLGVPAEKVRKVLKIAKPPNSPEAPITGEDNRVVVPLEAVIEANLRETTTRVLASLTSREERVLRMRFGLGTKTDATLAAVGRQFSVTRERIRQIEAKARAKLDRRRAARHTHAFRPVRAADLPLIRHWLRRPHVARWWSDPDKQIADLRRNLLNRRFDAHVLLLDDRPVGYLQCYDASPGAGGDVLGQPPGTRGLDLFIGEPWALAQGHGPAFVRRLTEQLLATPGVRRVIADPVPSNTRSMRCFEKAGFRRDAEVRQPRGPVVLMIRDGTQED